MKNITLTLSILSALALNALGQDEPAPGDRVEITFASGGSIIGKVVAPPPRAPMRSLTLDLSSEFPGLTGTITVPKQDIQGVRKLRILQERPGDLAQPPSSPAPVKVETPKAPAVMPERPPSKPPVDDAAKKAEEELQKAKEMFAKFPPPDWSPERRNAIRLKQYRGQIPTPTEREFEQGFDLWEKGRAAASKK